ncbi:MAG: hypothetical protein ACREFA_03465 [Stellaceae bacterium]
MAEPCDLTLDVLLDLDGQVLVVDPAGGHWVRFVVTRVPVSLEKPHGVDYSLTSTVRMASDWSVLITRIQWRGRSGVIRRIIGTDSERSSHSSIGMRRLCLRTSG